MSLAMRRDDKYDDGLLFKGASAMSAFIRISICALAASALFASSAPHAQNEPDSVAARTFTCPLGGESFTQELEYSAFPLITLPDGSWLGDTEIGVQIPRCPANGLVLLPDLAQTEASEDSGQLVYYSYTAAEIAALPGLIADPEYRALANDGPYAQAWWLADKLGRPAEDRLFMLQRSSWATRDPALRKRLVERFVTEAPAIISELGGGDTLKNYQQMFIINGLRELGRFDQALVLLDEIEASGEPVPGLPDPDNIFAPESPIGAMRLAILQADDGRFAAETLPDRLLNPICAGEMTYAYGPISPATRESCAIRHAREQQEAETFEQALALRDDEAALETECSTAALASRSGALKLACDDLQADRDRIAGNALTRDGPALAAACEATAEDQRSAVLSAGCSNYRMALSNALGDQLPDEPAAFAIICPGDKYSETQGQPMFVSMACSDAHLALEDRETQRLLADPDSLALRCASDEMADPEDISSYEVLLSACSSLEGQRDQLAISELAENPAKFDIACGRHARTNRAGNEVYDLSEEQEDCRRAWRLRENTRARELAGENGLTCFQDVIYSPERPRCVAPEEYAREMAQPERTGPDRTEPAPYDLSYLKEGSSMMQEAQIRAAAIIEAAKRTGRYVTTHSD